jgi:2-polyprenyl-3-methyl-5-hydroxy-6-metoxy-1,4-benzoquinol methylase
MLNERTKKRWHEEAAFFDRNAQSNLGRGQPIDPMAVQRFGARTLRRRFNKEFRFSILGSLQGKHVLDMGCGDGENSALLAKLGAQVTGIDLSPKAIDLARAKAVVSGVEENVRFVCSPLETVDLLPNSFDLIWGNAILHHLIENLEVVFQRLTLWAKAGALMVFAEPVNFNRTLRQCRFHLPIRTDATPDERPLEYAEVEIVRRYLPDFQMRHFSLFGRLDRFILIDSNYERSPFLRRAVVNSIEFLDYVFLSLPIFQNLAGTAVIYGHVSKQQISSVRSS